MKKLLTLFLFLFLPASVVFGEVSRFVFVTSPQIVEVNVISKAITIQSQNSGGVSEAVTETTDLVFDTTSRTGKFVASSGKPASKTMSKNTAKRTFYYIDSTPGTYTLTVKTAGRTSKESFSLSQNIVVGTEVKNIPIPPTSTLVPVAPVTPVLSKPIAVPVKTKAAKSLPIKPVEVASSTIETKVESELAAVVYTAPPKTSALESFLWLPRKIWGAVSSIF
jgi:hypothetical protein